MAVWCRQLSKKIFKSIKCVCALVTHPGYLSVPQASIAFLLVSSTPLKQPRQPHSATTHVYIYISSNLHPPPNSRWLHHTALRYMQRVQLGAYTWRKGLNLVKTGSYWAQNTWLSMPNGLRSLLGKHIFDPFLTHFWSHNVPFARHFGLFHGAKWVISGANWAKNTCLSIPNGERSLLEKCVFDPFLTHCWS